MMRDELDRYYTPDWCAKACVRAFAASCGGIEGWDVWEPHAGGGAFVRALQAHGADVEASDIDPDAGWTVLDFLEASEDASGWDAVIGNPPYRDAQAHVDAALTCADHVVFLLRLGFLESVRRSEWWKTHRPVKVWVISKRPSFAADGKTDGAAYALFWWARKALETETTLDWITGLPDNRRKEGK